MTGISGSCGWLKLCIREHRLRVQALGLGCFSPVATSFETVKLATCTSRTSACKHSLNMSTSAFANFSVDSRPEHRPCTVCMCWVAVMWTAMYASRHGQGTLVQ